MDNTPNSIASAYPSVSQEKGVIMQGNQVKPYDILYARLSSEDAGDGRSLSIDNQETQLRKRAEELGLDNPLFLVDDGISGTKNNRPQFQEALRLVEMRQVRSFMVTDLSRLYRNQAYANELLEEIFPSLNVRLISIAESYDTLTNGPSNEDMAMFSNLLNEYHPRMTSRKINALIHTKCENGVRIASIPPYGYQKDPEDKNKIVPDPEAAEMVKEIYRLCVAGLGPTQIAKQLEARKIPVPAEYAWRKFGRDHSHRNPDRPYAWSDGTVARILENPDYIGTQVNQKTHKVSYKSDKVIRVPRKNSTGLKMPMSRLSTVKFGRLFRRFVKIAVAPPRWERWMCLQGWYSVPTVVMCCTFAAAEAGMRISIHSSAEPIIAITRNVHRIPSRSCIFVS